jgi:hypothetical protein
VVVGLAAAYFGAPLDVAPGPSLGPDPPPGRVAVAVADGLAAAPEAFLGLLKGRNFGKQLVKLV